MDRLSFEPGELRNFIIAVQTKLGLDSNQLAKLVSLSGRTIRDWRKEKFKPTSKAIIELCRLSGVPIPKHEILSQYWYITKAAKLGGKRTYELHGLLGTKKTRSKGGKNSWLRRRNNPELLKKYTNSITKPEESADLAEFIGIMLGDGGLTHFQCIIYLHSEIDKEFAYYVSNLMNKLFGITSKIYTHKKHKVLRVSVSSVNLVKYLVSKGLSLGNKVYLQVGVPLWILSNEEYIKACIRGLIDTDGSFILHKYKIKEKVYTYPKISFSNRSEPLLEFVYQGLRKLGFNPKRTFKSEVWLHNQNEAKRYLEIIGVSNYKPNIIKMGWVAREA